MEDFCGCDHHGSCGEYNSTRFSESELLYHKEWDELYDSSNEEFRRNITICYCDAGWTGYSDMGTFHSEVLQNCAVNKIAITVLWAISSIFCFILVVNVIQRGLRQRITDKGIQAKYRVAIRFVSIVAYIGIALIIYMNKPWLVSAGVSPVVTVAYLTGTLCFMIDFTETQHKQVHRYFSKVFKDFGFGDRVKAEQIQLIKSLRVQQACMILSALVLGMTVKYGSTATCVIAAIVYYAVMLIILLVDVLIVDPKTNSRFLAILKRMIDVNATGYQHQEKEQQCALRNQGSNVGMVRMNSVSFEANHRLQEVYAKVAMANRHRRVQALVFTLSFVPFFFRTLWKYMGYSIVIVILENPLARTILYLLSLRRRTRKMKRLSQKTPAVNQVQSSAVSAFKSTAVSVAPLVTTAKVIPHDKVDVASVKGRVDAPN